MPDPSRPDSAPTVAAALQDQTIRKVAQNFYTKAALVVVSSRVNLPQCFERASKDIKVDKWFGLTLDDSDLLRAELLHWANLGIRHNTLSPLYVEIYLDSAELTRNDTIVIKDDRGRKWDACEAMQPLAASGAASSSRRRQATRIVLERWKINLVDDVAALEESRSESMAAVYKKAVVLFRTLWTFSRLLPAWEFGIRLAKEPASLTSLRPMFRITREEPAAQGRDALTTPLYPSPEPTTEHHVFAPINTPAGSMSVEVTFRRNCDFRIDGAEALLSSRFMGMDVQNEASSAADAFSGRKQFVLHGNEAGSLPSDRRPPAGVIGYNPAYGSMSTFHQVGARTGTSPISALRAAGEMNVESPTEEMHPKLPAGQQSTQAHRSSPRPGDAPPGSSRRVSVSFQPFKAGSLASSPGRTMLAPPSPRPPSVDALAVGSAPQNRPSSSASAAAQAVPRPGVSSPQEVVVASPGSASPKAPPMSRYSSSFGHRRSRYSSGGGSSRPDDGNTSSGKGSQSSSNQPESSLLAETEGSASGSIETDDSQISDFLKLIESKKELRSFNRTDEASREAAARKTNAALSRYRGMRDSNAALSDSMSSSMLAQSPAPSVTSRPPGSVPPMLAGASVSTSSSPGKPISPHTPHTPAVPSRLSAQAYADDIEGHGSGAGRERAERGSGAGVPRDGPGTGAIDIPTSPQRFAHMRRPSSEGQRSHAIEEDFGLRTSTSVPAGFDNRSGQDLSLDELFTHNEPASAGARSDERGSTEQRPEQDTRDKNSEDEHMPEGGRSAPTFRSSRLVRGGSSRRGSGGSTERSARFRFSHRPGAQSVEDDEPLVFMMTDMGNQG